MGSQGGHNVKCQIPGARYWCVRACDTHIPDRNWRESLAYRRYNHRRYGEAISALSTLAHMKACATGKSLEYGSDYGESVTTGNLLHMHFFYFAWSGLVLIVHNFFSYAPRQSS
jgi:hypothetical protein